ncbi:hypothetical protein [Sanguibacter antarcticus]|uniref:Uncharacterized protein n=1 Tax=Sanguibacter antarcticus TaxID=372484 RepID=A0A2A9E9A0_9MICO|nr:hypothetical protein [Sanguibacter antarcticus]PFG34819.1 hypothetical protein ATL42_2746 [Sanguibacter antarcticus]
MISSWFGRGKDEPADEAAPVHTDPVAPERAFRDEMHDAVRAIERSTKQEGRSLPVEASIQLFTMVDSLDELLRHTLVAPANVDEQIAIEFMVKDYIPSTITAYLASMADDATKDSLLINQLALLYHRVHSMMEAVYAHDSAQLEINGRFLREKFG